MSKLRQDIRSIIARSDGEDDATTQIMFLLSQYAKTEPEEDSIEVRVKDAIKRVLDGQEAMHCSRVWEAWSVGTMTDADFSLVTDDEEAFQEIVDAVLEEVTPQLVAYDEASEKQLAKIHMLRSKLPVPERIRERRGVSPRISVEDCNRCNYDEHVCPGCVANTSHWKNVCEECIKL